MPKSASEVDARRPFQPAELLYRRINPDELNSQGEIDPTRISAIGFKADLPSAPSVNRSDFSGPEDVLHIDCATRDVSGWLVYFVRVDSLPVGLETGDGRSFDFEPIHLPEERCGAHSVIGSLLNGDGERRYTKPSKAVVNEFKVKLISKLFPIDQTFQIASKSPVAHHECIVR